MDDTIQLNNAMESLPSLANVKRLKYDEICVHFSFSIKLNTTHRLKPVGCLATESRIRAKAR